MLLSYTVYEISTHYPRMARTEVKFPPLRGGGGGGGGEGAGEEQSAFADYARSG